VTFAPGIAPPIARRMTPFAVLLTPEAVSDIRSLDASVRARILDKVDWMGRNAALLVHHRLRGARWGGCFRSRHGDYRIIYQLKPRNRQMVILKIGHRRDVYE